MRKAAGVVGEKNSMKFYKNLDFVVGGSSSFAVGLFAPSESSLFSEFLKFIING